MARAMAHDNIVSFPRPLRSRDERTKPHPKDTPLLREFKTLAATIRAEQEDAREDFEAQRRLAQQAAERD